MTSKHTKKLRDAKYAANSEHIGWSIIEKAREALVQFAHARDIVVHSVEYVATFEDWDSRLGVFIFFPKDSDLRAHAKSGATTILEKEFKAILLKLEYPFDKFPDVYFEFDSDENVQKNYEGNYFFRLR